MARESDFTPLFMLPKWSFGLRQLFLWTAAIALALVALRGASPGWVAAMMGLALFVLSASILLVVFRRGSQRAYWIGFATFGWLYFLLLGASWQPVEPNSYIDTPLKPHNLLTQRLASASYHWLYDEAFDKYNASLGYAGGSMGGMGFSGDMPMYAGSGMGPGGMATGSGMGGVVPLPGPPPGPGESDFVNVAHALWTLLLAGTGGCIAYWLYTTGPARTERPAAAS